MIDDARALRDQVTSAAQLAEAEAARLWAFAAELDAFIVSAGGSADGAATNAAPNSPEPPVDPPRRRAPGTTTATKTCPDCGQAFKPAGFGPHRAKKHRPGADAPDLTGRTRSGGFGQ